MLRAVFARTLKPNATYEQFRSAWVPEHDGDYPVTATVSRDVANDRRVITILEIDIAPEQFAALAPSLTRPDAIDRLNEIVESTELEGVYEQLFDASTL